MEGKINSSNRLIVIGGGAAGIFCAVNAARWNPSLEVLVLEKSQKLLAKVKVSGGGRCNVTHACFAIEELIRKYPRGSHFLKKAFYHFNPQDTVNWFRERGVELKAEADGRMFPVTDDAQTIIDCLMREANRYGVSFRMNAGVVGLQLSGKEWTLTLSDQQKLQADAVCIACGGLPQATQLSWIRDLGLAIESPVPSLFTFNMPGHTLTRLMGVAVEKATVKIPEYRLEETGPLLITHWGLSGPVVLRLSAWGARQMAAGAWQFMVVVNWIPEYHENSLREYLQQYRETAASQEVASKNPFGLPKRLWELLVVESGITTADRWGSLPAKLQHKLIRNCCSYECKVSGKTTFKEEFVTAGGVSLKEIDPHTMQCRRLEGLYFAGEIMDVDGITGGFNFQHAWTSGWIAAKAISVQLNS